MSDQDLFKQAQGNDNSQTQSSDPIADKLMAIKNENGEPKYKDVNTALDALAHSQQFIKQLMDEKAEVERKRRELELEVEKRESVQAVVEKLTGKKEGPNTTQTADQPKGNGLSEAKVLELLEHKLSEQKATQKAQENINLVQNKLKSAFGEKAAEAIAIAAKKSNTTPKELEALSASNPELVLSLFEGIKMENSKPVTSSMNSSFSKKPDENPAPKFERSLMRGGVNNRDLAEAFSKVKDYTNKRLGIQS